MQQKINYTARYIGLLIGFLSAAAHADCLEKVTITESSFGTDQVLAIARMNGEIWRLEMGVGILGFAFATGKEAQVEYHARFGEYGMTLHSDDLSDQVEIWNATQVSAASYKLMTAETVFSEAMRELGFEVPNVTDQQVIPDLISKYTSKKNIPISTNLTYKVFFSLATDFIDRKDLLAARRMMMVGTFLSLGKSIDEPITLCQEFQRLRVVKIGQSGSPIELSDGTIWEIEESKRFRTSLWLAGMEIFLLDNKIYNPRKGQEVRVFRFK